MLDERAKKILADRLAQAALGEIDGIERLGSSMSLMKSFQMPEM